MRQKTKKNSKDASERRKITTSKYRDHHSQALAVAFSADEIALLEWSERLRDGSCKNSLSIDEDEELGVQGREGDMSVPKADDTMAVCSVRKYGFYWRMTHSWVFKASEVAESRASSSVGRC